MKKQIKKIEVLIEQLESKLDDMDCLFWDRSDNWRDSDKGQDFEDRMSIVETAILRILAIFT